MGSGGSGAGAGGGGYSGGGLANTGGTGYGGDLGGYGTAGEMSGGAGGAAMGGFGNTGAGGSGMSGVSSMSGMTPPGFTPAYGDPRGYGIGMDAFGNYKGTPGYAGMGSPTRATTMTPKAQTEMFGYVKYPSNPPKQTFSTPIPTQTAPLTVNPGYTPPRSQSYAPIGTLAPPSIFKDTMSRPNYPPARSDPRGAPRPNGGNLLGNPGSNMPSAPGFRNGPNRPGTF